MSMLAFNWGVLGTVLLVILAILVILLIVMYFLGRKMQKQQAEQQTMIEANTQSVSMLVIDKKKLKLKEAVAAGLPDTILTQTPFYLKLQKIPVVKAKIGPKVMTMIADPGIYESIPVKKECKVTISGLYIRSIQSVRGGVIEKPKEKKGLIAGLRKKVNAMTQTDMEKNAGKDSGKKVKK